jgi:ribosomal protein S18 acetylase RimI-like enzyme
VHDAAGGGVLPADPRTPAIDSLAETNHASLLCYHGRYPGALLDDQLTHLRLWTGLHSGFFNAVARVRWSTDVAPAAVRAFSADLSSRRVPWRWYVGSAGGSDEVIRMLKAVGLRSAPAQTPMILTITPRILARLVTHARPVPGLHVAQVRDRAGMRAWVAARTASSGLSPATSDAWLAMHLGLGLGEDAPLQHLVGRIGGRPAGSISVFLDVDGTAGIYHVDVVPEARGQGVATWLTAAAIGLAADQDAQRVILTSTPAALALYRRLGFVAQGSFTYFVDPVLGP